MNSKKVPFIILFTFLAAFTSFADELQPQAMLRDYNNCTDANKCYVVEIYMPESLKAEQREILTGIKTNCPNPDGTAAPCVRPKIAVLFNGITLSQYPVTLSDKDKLLSPVRQGRVFAIFLPKTQSLLKPLQVVFEPYSTNGTVLHFPSAKVGTDHTVSFAFDGYNKVFRHRVRFGKDPIACDDKDSARRAAAAAAAEAPIAAAAAEAATAAAAADPKNPALAAVAKDAVAKAAAATAAVAETAANHVLAVNCNEDKDRILPAHLAYINQRLKNMSEWAKGLRVKEVELKVEDLTKCLKYKVEDPPKSGTFIDKGCVNYNSWEEFVAKLKLPQFNGPQSIYDFLKDKFDYVAPPSTPPSPEDQIRLGNLLQEYLRKKRAQFLGNTPLTAADLPPTAIEMIDTSPAEDARLNTDRGFLVDYYTVDALPAKFSAQLKLLARDMPFEFAKAFKATAQEIEQIAVNPKEDTGKVGERTRPNRLDVAFLFGSSVAPKEETVNNVKVKTIKRTTLATLDLRVNPFNAISLTGSPTKALDWVPIFLDAKVSNGKVTENTLSVNRVVFGTEFNGLKLLKSRQGTNPNYLGYSIKGVNASDRDFKQLEYKGVFEFQPRLAFLNRIPANFRNTVNRVILGPDDKPGDIRLVAPSFGYKIQPVLGGEIGKAWFRRNPAAAIKPTDYIRRVYTGLDLTFYLPMNSALTFSDKFYWSFGKNVDRRENYFKVNLDVGIRKTQGYGDSIFLTFEKGNLPPFGPRDVNAFKFGYRFVNPKFLSFW